MHIFEDSVISLGIFQLPMGASIPLHDHPGMTVISRCPLPRCRATPCFVALAAVIVALSRGLA